METAESASEYAVSSDLRELERKLPENFSMGSGGTESSSSVREVRLGCSESGAGTPMSPSSSGEKLVP